MTRLRWSIQRLAYVLLIVGVLGILASGLAYAPLVQFVSDMSRTALSFFLALGCLSLLLVRLYRLERTVSQMQEQHKALQTQLHNASARLEAVTAEVPQLTQALHDVQQAMAHSEWMWPGKLLLAQRRYDEAIKVFQDVLPRAPTHPRLHWSLGEALCGARRYAEALPHLRAGLVADDVTHLALLAQCEQALGHYTEAETHLLRVLEGRGEVRQDDLMTLATVQGELEPARARQTLRRALALNPYNSAVRYQLIGLELHLGAYEQAIALATEGVTRNPADVGCCVSRAEAYFRRGRREDEERILRGLATAQAKNRKDYNIYRLRGAVYQRRASRVKQTTEVHQTLHQALDAYAEGVMVVPPKFHAHLLVLQSRVYLQLKRFDDAVAQAQRAVEHTPGHVSNHLALAFAHLAAQQWHAAVQAAEAGRPWASGGSKVWLTAMSMLARVCAGGLTAALRQQCAVLADALQADGKRFTPSESWSVVRDLLLDVAAQSTDSCGALVTDTMALLEGALTPENYCSKWTGVQEAHGVVA
jgi:tetratricopeptide (TPR) repeat protein